MSVVHCFLFLLWFYSCKEKIVLGNKIGETYIAECPGYYVLEAFDNGKCKIIFGGILGDTDIFILDYKIEKDTFWVVSTERIFKLELSSIEIGDRKYTD